MPLKFQPNQTKHKQPEPFRWLFFAVFDDGETITQTQEDKCLTRDDGTGSAFTDVLAYQDKHKLRVFGLDYVDDGQFVSVDLDTGNFIISGTPVSLHNQNFNPEKYDLKLIYFRETRVDQTQNAKGEVQSQRHYVNRYFIGWECLVNGKNKQVTLAVG